MGWVAAERALTVAGYLRPLDRIERALGPGRKAGGQRLFRCPAHADKSPSLAVRERQDGTVLLHCHAGCRTPDVLDALGLGWADLFPEDRPAW